MGCVRVLRFCPRNTSLCAHICILFTCVYIKLLISYILCVAAVTFCCVYVPACIYLASSIVRYLAS